MAAQVKQYLFIDIDDTLSPALVTLINAMDPTLPRVVVTARLNTPGRYAGTFAELNAMGLDFDELYLRDREGLENRSPAKFKVAIVERLRHDADMWPLVAIDDDLSVGAALKAAGVPVVRVLA